MSTLDAYQEASTRLSMIWMDFHIWYATPRDPRVHKEHLHLICSNRKTTRGRFYREIRKKSAMKHIAWCRVLDEGRFDAFSAIFYNQTRVDVEFARRTIYKMLR